MENLKVREEEEVEKRGALYLCTSIPAILYCILLQFFVTESPRWLYMHGFVEEAIAILEKSSAPNYPSELKLLLVSTGMPSEGVEETSKTKNHPYKSMKDLFAKRWAMKRTLTVMVLGFGIGMVYYGMPLGVGNLGFNIYLIMFNALLEIPSYPITCIILERWSRKYSVLAFCLVSGICGILCAIVGNGQKGIRIGLELASFFCSRTAWNLISMFTVELFPTCVRNSATSLLRQSYVLSAVFSSILVSVRSNNGFLSYGVFGLAIFFSGFFVACLPDTRGGTLCDTMEEQEGKEKMILG
ncbi:hypothetical protein L3X38_022645 [Prunus dulcis]|uniref:Uncharacterized protein n=1 Tax=Prunus dulcis TaxID=3755 RepID=A0AAD4VXB6_PRUDU|nr:hypothetical protein L3X38_022645 [Prunus dulcis]